MTNQDIYLAALRLSCEVETPGENADYAERAGYLLPLFCTRCAALDAAYRAANGLEEQALPDALPYLMEADFPLSPIFASPASASLASLLTAAENPDLSSFLAGVCSDALAQIRAGIPFRKESILNCYGG